MATSIVMPQLGYDMREGTVVRWVKQEGDEVIANEVIAEIETDKAVVEFKPTTGGVLRRIVAGEGEAVPVGQLIAVIGDADEALPDDLGGPAAPTAPAAAPETAPAPTPAAATSESPAGEVRASPIARRLAREKGVDLATVTGSGPGGRIVEADVLAAADAVRSAAEAGRVLASPLARRLAREQGIDLSAVTGTGPGGRVVEADVNAAAAAQAATPAVAEPTPGPRDSRDSRACPDRGRRPRRPVPHAAGHRQRHLRQQTRRPPLLRRRRHRHDRGHGPPT